MTTLFSVLLSITFYSASTTDCNDYFQCESQTITDAANCYGYASCHSTTIQTDNSVHCDGAHSCHSAQIDTSHSIYCRSVASCKNANLQISSEIYCEGVESCADSTINTAGKVYSYGHYGAAGAYISDASTIRGYGYYSLLYSTIDSGVNNKMSVKIYGVDAGYGANILCQSGSKCTLTCKSGGCLELDFICFEGALCSVLPEQCLSDNSIEIYDGISCPNLKISLSKDDDNIFMKYIKEKEMYKEDNVKYQLFETYTAYDTQSFNSKIENKKKVLYDNIFLFNNTYRTNTFYYLFGAIIVFVIIGIYVCASKLCNMEYQKM